MPNCLTCFGGAAALAIALSVQTAKPAEEASAANQMTLKGCVRAVEPERTAQAGKNVTYTLEVPEEGPSTPPQGTAGSVRTADSPKKTYQLSETEAVKLSQHVGKMVQLTGELLQPPSTPPGVTRSDPESKTKPLPHDSAGTFRVSSVKVLSSKCQ